jgi:hypothetical protein
METRWLATLVPVLASSVLPATALANPAGLAPWTDAVAPAPQRTGNLLFDRDPDPFVGMPVGAEPRPADLLSMRGDRGWDEQAGRGLPDDPTRPLEPPVLVLPPPPGAGSLTLSGLLTLGAWQAARSARGASVAALLRGASLCGAQVQWADPLPPTVSVFGRSLIASPSPACEDRRHDPAARKPSLAARGDRHRPAPAQCTPSIIAPRAPPRST